MNKNNLRYIAYVRKSEERKERQELSHTAQTRKIKEHFPDLNIVKWMPPESKSAFKTGRPIFKQAMDLIDQGKADGIVSYFPNRLSRNEIDSGRLTYALRGPLKDLRFCTYNFENTPEGIMMLQMVMNQGQYESSKQGRDVKRGMEEKVINGERPGVVPTGYYKKPLLNEHGELMKNKENKIITKTAVDHERFDHVRQMWHLLLSGVYTPREIRRIANEDWGYTLRATSKTGGGPIGLSTIYRMFTNPFYAGWIRHNGQLYEGSHEAVITLEEFDYAQKLLGKRGKPRLNAHEYAFTSLMKCGECGCSIAGKTNEKFVKSKGKLVTYVHYFCIKKSEKRPCTQTKYTRVEDLENEIMDELTKYEILPEFRDLAISILKRDNALEVHDRQTTYKSQQKARSDAQKRLDGLVDMRLRGQLDDEEYEHQRSRYKQEISKLDGLLRNTEGRADQWLELTERAFNFATYARYHFEHGDLRTKRDILMTLGDNLLLKDNKITLQPSKWLIPIGKAYPTIKKAYLRRGRTNTKTSSDLSEEANVEIMNSWRAI